MILADLETGQMAMADGKFWIAKGALMFTDELGNTKYPQDYDIEAIVTPRRSITDGLLLTCLNSQYSNRPRWRMKVAEPDGYRHWLYVGYKHRSLIHSNDYELKVDFDFASVCTDNRVKSAMTAFCCRSGRFIRQLATAKNFCFHIDDTGKTFCRLYKSITQFMDVPNQ